MIENKKFFLPIYGQGGNPVTYAAFYFGDRGYNPTVINILNLHCHFRRPFAMTPEV